MLQAGLFSGAYETVRHRLLLKRQPVGGVLEVPGKGKGGIVRPALGLRQCLI